MDKSTKAILAPFLAAMAKPKQPYIAKVKSLGNGYIVLSNGLKVPTPSNKSIKTGDTVAVVEGRVV